MFSLQRSRSRNRTRVTQPKLTFFRASYPLDQRSFPFRGIVCQNISNQLLIINHEFLFTTAFTPGLKETFVSSCVNLNVQSDWQKMRFFGTDVKCGQFFASDRGQRPYETFQNGFSANNWHILRVGKCIFAATLPKNRDRDLRTLLLNMLEEMNSGLKRKICHFSKIFQKVFAKNWSKLATTEIIFHA